MREITFGAAVNEAMAEEMRLDESIIILGEDVQRLEHHLRFCPA